MREGLLGAGQYRQDRRTSHPTEYSANTESTRTGCLVARDSKVKTRQAGPDLGLLPWGGCRSALRTLDLKIKTYLRGLMARDWRPSMSYEIPSGVRCIYTRGVDYSTRRESVTTKRLRFDAFVREGAYTYQFESQGWFLVVGKWEVVRVGE